MDDALGSRIESGLRWSVASQVVTQAAGALAGLAYIRLLRPEDLGAAGMAFLVYNGLVLLVQSPIRDAVVYYREREDAYAGAAFWLLMGFAALAVALVLLGADWFAGFYQSPLAAPLTRVAAAAFLLRALSVVPGALLIKRFRFALYESLQTATLLITFAGWIVCASAGLGAWSLVLPEVAGAALWSAGTWLAARFRPVARPGRQAYRDILAFSRALFGGKLMTYLRANADNFAVGTLGTAALGAYNFGESQSEFAALSVGASIAQVTLPAMAAARTDHAQAGGIYLDMLRLAATLSTPMYAGTIVLAELGLRLFFGEQWLPAVPVLQLYMAMQIVNTLAVVTDSATSAMGRPDLRFKVELAQFPFLLAGIWLGVQAWGGITGVALALALVRGAAGAVYIGASLPVVRVAPWRALRYLLPSALAAGGMSVLVYFAQPRLASLPPAARLAALVAVGAAACFALLFALDRRGTREVFVTAWCVLVPPAIRKRR